MSEKICIFPQDKTTDFLSPIYELLVSQGYEGFHVDTNIFDIKGLFTALRKAKDVVFLGHGSSGKLYGSPNNTEQVSLIGKDEMDMLRDKHLFLLSCNSSELGHYYGLTHVIGFDDIPTDRADVLAIAQNELFPNLQEEDILVYNRSLVNAVCFAFGHGGLQNMNELYNYLRLAINMEVVRCLLQKTCPMYRDVADCLQKLKNDCEIF